MDHIVQVVVNNIVVEGAEPLTCNLLNCYILLKKHNYVFLFLSTETNSMLPYSGWGTTFQLSVFKKFLNCLVIEHYQARKLLCPALWHLTFYFYSTSKLFELSSIRISMFQQAHMFKCNKWL